MDPHSPFRIILIGASAGGHAAVLTTLKDIPPDINACFLVVIHTSFDATSAFASYLDGKINLRVKEARHGMPIEAGTVYVAVPNNHLALQGGEIMLTRGPRENLFRPSIDVLFRTAAVSQKNRCVGVLLTGRLNDGTAGLSAIKRCGGLTVIQNPRTSEYAEMPRTAQREVEIDHTVNLEDMGEAIIKIAQTKLPPEITVPRNLVREAGIAMKIESQVATDEALGEQVPLSCSSCGGPLWKMDDPHQQRFRCHVGHSFTQEALLESQNTALEETLWIALRTLEEKQALLKRIILDYDNRGFKTLVPSYKDKLAEVKTHAERLRTLMRLHD
ncbi:chemotaxis protein CheB [Persicitalea jodogahamensis]|uniref:protein-glutamate methylesterase n=1 Tax=Persicitalea jodogahamensis TaxID=402147 RepID=A0A8J3D4E4_9BACT|nr:chemotaxis protein CheB [Persicitalea jodogahamensis]GHB73342.1 chemotaxis protein-glutamate methylesterase [Persicitalea jodogahamensis]